MKTPWPSFALEMYERACLELNYPEEPFSEYIKEFIRENDVVADIGCGIGVPAVYISKLCKKVIAIDCNEGSLAYFKKNILQQNIKNIETVLGEWPDVRIEPCDIAVAFFVSKIADNNESMTALLDSVKRGGIITSNGTSVEGGFYKDLAARLGVKPRSFSCENGCYLRGKLEMSGCKVKCGQKAHDFGQPVNDLEEAAKFLCWQLHLNESYLERIQKMAQDYVIKRKGKMYIPKLRSTCVLTFEK